MDRMLLKLLHVELRDSGSVAKLLYGKMVRSLVDIAIGTVCAIVILVTLVTNVLVVYLSSKRKKSSPSTMFIVSLAIADIFVAILVMPCTAYATLNSRIWNLAPWTCKLHICTEIFFWTASVLHFPVLALDRYEAVHQPLKYSRNSRKVKSAITVGLVWSTAAVVSFLLYTVIRWPQASGQRCLLNTKYIGLWSLSCFYVPLVVSLVLYMCVYRKIKTSVGQSAVSGLAEARARESRVAKVLLIAVMSFIVCIAPITVVEIMRFLAFNPFLGLPQIVLSILVTAKQSNSTCNGVIMLTCNREYRSKLLTLIGLNRDGQQDNSHPLTESRSQSKTTDLENS
ncbi:5-hydroxytryptamine receptor 1D [Halotydeus destructor]|nr:5-hydroxytryptamine receptor 1D [Halotydeus destructor]